MLFLKKLKQAAGKKKIVVVLTGGSPIACPEVEELADAILGENNSLIRDLKREDLELLLS